MVFPSICNAHLLSFLIFAQLAMSSTTPYHKDCNARNPHIISSRYLTRWLRHFCPWHASLPVRRFLKTGFIRVRIVLRLVRSYKLGKERFLCPTFTFLLAWIHEVHYLYLFYGIMDDNRIFTFQSFRAQKRISLTSLWGIYVRWFRFS